MEIVGSCVCSSASLERLITECYKLIPFLSLVWHIQLCTVSYVLNENVTLSTELLSKECENMAEMEFGMGCLLNLTLTFTEQLLQSTGLNWMPQLLSMSRRHKSGVTAEQDAIGFWRCFLYVPGRFSAGRLSEATFWSPFKNQLTYSQEILDTAANFLSFSAFIWLLVFLLFICWATAVTS